MADHNFLMHSAALALQMHYIDAIRKMLDRNIHSIRQTECLRIHRIAHRVKQRHMTFIQHLP